MGGATRGERGSLGTWKEKTGPEVLLGLKRRLASLADRSGVEAESAPARPEKRCREETDDALEHTYR